MQLRPLQPTDEKAVSDFVAAFQTAGEDSIPAFFRHPHWSHAELVDIHRGWSEGVDRSPPGARLFEDAVPCTTRFLVDEGANEILGVVNVRHRLNPFLERFGGHIGYSVRPTARRRGHAVTLLREGLAISGQLGHKRVMLTCEPSNLGSVRTIERCGGVLTESFHHDAMGVDVQLYWIEIAEVRPPVRDLPHP